MLCDVLQSDRGLDRAAGTGCAEEMNPTDHDGSTGFHDATGGDGTAWLATPADPGQVVRLSFP